MKISKRKLKNVIRKLIIENDLYVFDFDETLGTTPAKTNVAAIKMSNVEMDDAGKIKKITLSPEPNLQQKLKDMGIPTTDLDKEFQKYLENNRLRRGDPGIYDPLAGAEMVALDTDQYKIWKNAIARDHTYVNSGRGLYGSIEDAAEVLAKQGKTDSLIFVRDFSPSFQLGTVKPIKQNVDLARSRMGQGDPVGVVTARAGKSKLPMMGGGEDNRSIQATNQEDIEKFMRSQAGGIDFVYGAADRDPKDPSNAKRDIIRDELSARPDHDLHFYDDDIQNIKKVQQLCDDPKLSGREITTYHADFHKGEQPKTEKCTVGSANENIARQVQMRIRLKKIINEVIYGR
jgi:hypothetical protein